MFAAAPSLAQHGVSLVKEDNGRRPRARHGEKCAHKLLALAVVFGRERGCGDGEEAAPTLS